MKNEYNMDELLPLLSERVKKYTSNESTSITYNKARQLMNSILYCMNEDNSKEPSTNLIGVGEKIKVDEVFITGLNTKKIKIEQAKKVYREIRATYHAYGNLCYYETIVKGMPAFFEKYDVEFDAMNHILTLDYPLVIEIKGLSGIDLIYEYLRKIQLEQLFLIKFSAEWVKKMLLGYHEEYSEYILNICKIILRNIIACRIINKPIHEITMEEVDLEQLKGISSNKTVEELEVIFSSSLKELIKSTYEGNIVLFEYLILDMKEFAFEFKTYSQRNGLEQLFTKNQKKVSDEVWFEDGATMDDATLIKLIDEMKECRFLSDKLLMLESGVKGLEDLKEVLKECFFEGEYGEVFELLSEEERKVLKKEIKNKIEINEELNEWEKVLWEF